MKTSFRRAGTTLWRRLALVVVALVTSIISVAPQSGDPIPGYMQQVDVGNLTVVATDLVTQYGPRREDRFSPYLDGACTTSGVVYPQTTLDMAADYIRDRFLAMGYAPSAITMEVLPGTAGTNVYVTKTGTTYPNVFIEFSGHYDSVDGSPGGADNASGATAVIELARVLKDYQSRYSLRFVLWAAEEFSPQRNAAFYGSNVHVQQALSRGEQIKAGLVMDHIGWANPADPTGYFNEVSYWGDESNRIAGLFGTLRTRYGLGLGVGTDQAIQNSDEHSYWTYGQVAVSSGGGWLFNRPNYHGCGDTVANIDFTNVQRVAQLNLAVGLTLDAEPFGATGTTTALASAPNPSLLGQSVTLTATVSATQGAPTGTVTFRDGTTTIATASLDASGVASVSTSLLAEGTHGLTASYGGDAAHTGSTSATLTHTVSRTGSTAPTITALTPSSAFAGDPGFALVVTGTNFGAGSTVRWNGADRTTTILSSTQLSAAIGSADIAAAGTAYVTVFVPGTGGGTSAAAPFAVAARPTGRIRAAYGMEEGGGTSLVDASGNGNSGAAQNGVSWGPGRYGTGLAFDGQDDYVTIANSPSIDLSGLDLTIEAWVNVATGAPSGVLLAKPWVAGQSSYPFYQYALAYDGGTQQFVFSYGTTTFGLRSFPIAVPTTGWHHVAFTADSATSFVRGYVDGAQQLSVQVPFPLEARGTPLLLGVDGALASPFQGSLDDVRIYAVALTAAEVQADLAAPVAAGSTAPVITAISPASGSAGSAVTISGSRFTDATLVRFNATDQPVFTVLDAGTIATTVPAGATTGPVQVVSPSGVATSPSAFAVTTPPVLNVNSVTVTESGMASFSVTLSASSSQAVSVSYATSPGTATAGSDYTATSGSLTFDPGVTSRTVTVATLDDALDEADETFTLVLSAPSNAALGTSTGTATIADNDDPPAVAVGDVTVTEGNSGTTGAVFVVTLSAPSGREITVAYATADGSANAGADYTVAGGTLTFPAGATTRTVTVPVIGDTFAEADESFTLGLGVVNGASVADGVGIGTIIDDDGVAMLGIGNGSVTEGNSGTRNLTFTVTLAPASSQTVTVQFDTLNGTAVAGADFTTASGTLSFAPGVTSQTIAVPVIGDTRDEPDETFTVALSAPVNAAIGTATGTGTILDDDARPSLRVNDVSVTEGNAATTSLTFTLTLSAASGMEVSVAAASADGTAVAGADYTAVSTTVTFPPGVISRTVTVPVAGDLLDEPNETFTLRLSSAVNGSIADSSGTGTITDDDPAPTLAIDDITVSEGAGLATFTVSLSAASGRTVSVRYATANGSASANSDYTAASGTLSFAPGTTTMTVTVPILDNAVREATETFTIRLSRASGATIGDSTGVCTILDND